CAGRCGRARSGRRAGGAAPERSSRSCRSHPGVAAVGEDLLLPHGQPGLDGLDDLAAHGEREVTVRAGGTGEDGDVADAEHPDPVAHGHPDGVVGAEDVRDDLLERTGRVGVGAVLEAHDGAVRVGAVVPDLPDERRDGTGPRRRDGGEVRGQVERLLADRGERRLPHQWSPPTSWSRTCSRSGPSTAMVSSTPLVLPGALTTTASPTVPASARLSTAPGASLRRRTASTSPGSSRSRTSAVASGVRSVGLTPVPPVVRTTRAPSASADRSASRTGSTPSGTTRTGATANPS